MKIERKTLVFPFLVFGLVANMLVGCTADGDESNQTNEDAPIVVTSTVSNIATTSATSGGEITSLGDTNVTNKGVCWNTSGTPTIDDSKTTDGEGDESFTSEITGLNANSTYYVRAYATNEFGTGYGNVKEFKTAEQKITNGADVKDIDGNVYRTVVIGSQTWMVQNLKVTKYNDGTSIETTIVNADWNKFSGGAYCWYNNDETTNKNIYGAIYNWYAVNTGKLCPTGWHVPTNKEWETLTVTIGGIYNGEKLKEAGTAHWKSPNAFATNETGFTAVPGGTRNYFGSYDAIGTTGTWWSSTVPNDQNAWFWQLNVTSSAISNSQIDKASGYSVRCIKD